MIFYTTLRAFRSTIRHAENIWKRTHSASDWSSFKSLSNIQAHHVFQKRVLLQPPTTPKHLWQTVNKLLHRKSSSPLPTTSPGTSLVDSFASFFSQAKYPNSVFLSAATLVHHFRTDPLLLAPATPSFLSFHFCLRIRNLPDPVQLSKQAVRLS